MAGYKVPRQLHVVDKIERSPSGKPDYQWANAIVTSSPAVDRASRRTVDRDEPVGPHRVIPATGRRLDILIVPVTLADLVGGGQAAVLTMEIQRGVVGDLSSFPELAAAAARGRPGGQHGAAARRGTRRRGARGALHRGVPSRSARVPRQRPAHLRAAAPARAPRRRHARGRARPRDRCRSPVTSSRTEATVCPRSPARHLDATLRALGVTTVVATGVSVNLGIVGLAVEAVNLGYRVVVATDAVCGVPSDYADAVTRHTLALVATLATADAVCWRFCLSASVSAPGARRPRCRPVACSNPVARRAVRRDRRRSADPGGAEGDTAAATRPSAGTNEDPPQATTLEPPALTHR